MIRGGWGGSVQGNSECICLELLDFADLLIALGLGLGFVAVVPVDVLVLLPAAGRGVDAVAEVVLVGWMSAGHWRARGRRGTDLAVFVCGDVGPLELCLAAARAASDGLEHCGGRQEHVGKCGDQTQLGRCA